MQQIVPMRHAVEVLEQERQRFTFVQLSLLREFAETSVSGLGHLGGKASGQALRAGHISSGGVGPACGPTVILP